MGRNRQNWKPGDVFTVPLLDGSNGFGQVISHEPQALNSVLCAFFQEREKESGTATQRCNLNEVGSLLAVQLVTRDLLDNGGWEVVGNSKSPAPEPTMNIAKLRKNGFVGATVIGSGNMTTLLNAYFGLAAWNMYFDEHYFDKLLFRPDLRPKVVVLKQKN